MKQIIQWTVGCLAIVFVFVSVSIARAGEGAELAPECKQWKQKSLRRPNIIFFFTDDQRFDTIHALGNEQILTPHLDSLVREGTTFTNAYYMGGMCVPSRAMLMTGRTLFRCGWKRISKNHTTLPEVLQRAGYTAFHVGKWHNDRQSLARSFSAGAKISGLSGKWYGWVGRWGGHWNVPVYDFDPTAEFPPEKAYIAGGPDGARRLPISKDVTEGTHTSELFSDAAIRFLRDYKDHKPFFLYVAYKAPHDPLQSPKKYRDMYPPEKICLPKNFMPKHPFDNGAREYRDRWQVDLEGRGGPPLTGPLTPNAIRGHIADYYAIITHLDAQIGRVLATLKDTGQAENTIIAFSSDNGMAVGRHGLLEKQNVYEHGVHVPLIISGPGIPKDQRRDALCYLLDIYPTICHLTGVSIPDTVEGKSLTPVIRDPKQSIRDTLFFSFGSVQRSVRDDRYKLIEYVVKGKRTTQLFDLHADPWELNNLVDDPGYAQQLTRLRKELLRLKDELGDRDEKFWKGYASG